MQELKPHPDPEAAMGALVSITGDIGLAAVGGVQRQARGEAVVAEAGVVRLADALQVAGFCAQRPCCW